MVCFDYFGEKFNLFYVWNVCVCVMYVLACLISEKFNLFHNWNMFVCVMVCIGLFGCLW